MNLLIKFLVSNEEFPIKLFTKCKTDSGRHLQSEYTRIQIDEELYQSIHNIKIRLYAIEHLKTIEPQQVSLLLLRDTFDLYRFFVYLLIISFQITQLLQKLFMFVPIQYSFYVENAYFDID